MENVIQNCYDKELLRSEIQKLCLMDDMLMKKAFDGCNECSQVLLQVILNNATLMVEKTKTQHLFNSIDGHSVILDIYAVDTDGKHYDVEIQKAKKGSSVKRARYYSAMLDSNILPKGSDYEKLGETYIIFITEQDVWGENKPLYNIERCLVPEGKQINDGAHIIYVNASIKNETPLGKLMSDMFCNSPENMHYKELADRVEFFKSKEGGIDLMCELSEKLIRFGKEQGIKEGIKEGEASGALKKSIQIAKALLLKKNSIEDVAEVTGLTYAEVEKLAQEL